MTEHGMREAGPDGLASVLKGKGALTRDWLPAYRAVPRHLYMPDAIWPGRAGMNRQTDRVLRDGAGGYPQSAPYDRVIATCSIGSVPSAWRAQTKPGGVIVTPWGPAYGGEAVARLTVAADGSAAGPFVGSSAFMRMRAQRKRLPPTSAFLDGAERPGAGDRSETTLSPDDVGDWMHMFVIGVRVPDLFCRVDRGDAGAYRLWLMDTGVTSWATADYARDRTRYAVVQCGPRRLWEELEAAWRWWEGAGRPGFDRFGLTVDDDGERVWLDDPDHEVGGASCNSRKAGTSRTERG